ncbi:MAG: flagellar export chaperone FliS [Clostridiales bacterium]|jgi:flagellar protein FliS|nr:flagellar export chaperone FliS [Clostridiales bacterium]
MAVKNPYAKMTEDAVFTASKEELTLMLYEGALKFANQALVAIESKNYIKANELLLRVQDIIREFQLTLNDKYEISKNFRQLYDYIFRLLIDANIRKEKAPLEEARDYLREFRDMWKEAMRIAKQQPQS